MYCQKGNKFMSLIVIVIMFMCNQIVLADTITGSGTTNYIPKFSGTATIDNSVIYQSDGKIGIGTTNPTAALHITGWSYDWAPTTSGIQLANKDNTARIEMTSDGSTPFIDFHNDLTGIDYDMRIILTGDDALAIDGGNLGIGTTSPTEKLTVRGNILVQRASDGTACLELGEGLDYSEGFDLSQPSKNEPGSVLIIDSENPGKLTLSTKSYDTKVAGITAGAKELGSGVRLGVGQFDCDVALAGRVYCNVDATEYEIQPGDLLTTSNTTGFAMKAQDYDKAKGATLGKAMERLVKGKKGQILVLVTLQ